MSNKMQTLRAIAAKLKPVEHDETSMLYGTPGWKAIRRRALAEARRLYIQAENHPTTVAAMHERADLDHQISEAGNRMAELCARRKKLPPVASLIAELVLRT